MKNDFFFLEEWPQNVIERKISHKRLQEHHEGGGTYRVWLGDWAEACGSNANKIYRIWVAEGIIWDMG